MIKILTTCFLFIFQSYSQRTITIYFDDIEMNYFAKNSVLLSSNEFIRDTIIEKYQDGKYLYTELCKDEYLNKIRNIPIRTISGQFKEHMKNGYFVQTEFFISKINKMDTLINTRQITQYKNGQRDGVNLILQYRPIFKKKELVEYDISIEKFEIYEEDIQVGVSFERKKSKSKKKNQIRITSLLSIPDDVIIK